MRPLPSSSLWDVADCVLATSSEELEGKVTTTFVDAEPSDAARPARGTRSHSFTLPSATTSNDPPLPAPAPASTVPFPPRQSSTFAPSAASGIHTSPVKKKSATKLSKQPASRAAELREAAAVAEQDKKEKEKAKKQRRLTAPPLAGPIRTAAPSTRSASAEARPLTRRAAKDKAIDVEGIFPMRGEQDMPDSRRRKTLPGPPSSHEGTSSSLPRAACTAKEPKNESGDDGETSVASTVPASLAYSTSSSRQPLNLSDDYIQPFQLPPSALSRSPSVGFGSAPSHQPTPLSRSPLRPSPLVNAVGSSAKSVGQSLQDKNEKSHAVCGEGAQTTTATMRNDVPPGVHVQHPTSPVVSRNTLPSTSTLPTSATNAALPFPSTFSPPPTDNASSDDPFSAIDAFADSSTSSAIAPHAHLSGTVNPAHLELAPFASTSTSTSNEGRKRHSVTYGGSASKRRRLSGDYEDVLALSSDEESGAERDGGGNVSSC